MPTKSQFDAAGYLRKRYADHLSQGLCRWCDEPICADSICMCDYHLRLHRKRAKVNYWGRKLQVAACNEQVTQMLVDFVKIYRAGSSHKSVMQMAKELADKVCQLAGMPE